MNKQTVLVGLGSATVSAVVTYFVMEMIHANEIAELYKEVESAGLQAIQGPPGPAGPMGMQGPPGDASKADTQMRLVSGVKIYKEFVDEIVEKMPRDVKSAAEAYGSDFHVEEEDDEEDTLENDISYPFDEDEEDIEELDVAIEQDFDGIFVIPNDEVAGNQVIVLYDHETHTFEVARSLSAGGDDLDDEILPREFIKLVGRDVCDQIINSEPEEDKRIVCVRNNQKNLDFVIGY